MTTRTITGPIYEPDLTAIALGTVRFRALRNNYSASASVPKGFETEVVTSVAGAFSVDIALGDYRVEIQPAGTTLWKYAGDIAVEAGSSIVIGDLIDQSRDKTADYSVSVDWVTMAEMVAYVDGGAGSPGDLDVTDLGIGTAIARDVLEINKGGSAIIGVRHLGMSMTFGGL